MSGLLIFVLVLRSVFFAFIGLLFLSEATAGVGILCFAAILGIWARLVQAGRDK